MITDPRTLTMLNAGAFAILLAIAFTVLPALPSSHGDNPPPAYLQSAPTSCGAC